MGVELMKEHVGIAMRGCHRLASRHPLLTFMTLVLIWIYRSFPSLFALLVDASPVIASTTFLLGILLFLGHSNAPEIQKEEKPFHHKIHNLKFGVLGDTEADWRGERPERRAKTSRKKSCVVHRVNVNDNHHSGETDKLGSSIGKKFKQEAKSGVGNQKEKIVLVHKNEDDKGWETGSELAESTSPTASMTDIFSLHDEFHQLHDHPQVPQHAHMLNLSTHAESYNSEENDHGDIHVKDDEEKEKEEEEEDRKNHLNSFALPNHSNEKIIDSAPSSSMVRSSDISYDSSRQESDPIDFVPSKPNNQSTHHHEKFNVDPSTLMASKQGKQGYNLETPDATNYSSMHREMDELSESNMSSSPDTESVGVTLTKDEPSRQHDSTSIKGSFNTESVASSHYEDDPREDDLISVKEGNYKDDSTSVQKGVYTESVASSHYEDDPREDDLISMKEGNYEDVSTSVKKGVYTESVASSHYEDDPREDDLISVKEGNYEDDSTSVKKGVYTESVASSHYEDDPREDDLISVKEGNYEDDSTSVKKGVYTESVASSHYEDDPREDDLISVKEGNYEDDSTSVKKGVYTESVASSHYEDDPREDDLISVKEGNYEDDSTSVKKGVYTESVASSHYEDDPREDDLISVKEGNYEDDSTSVKKGVYTESVASSHYEDDSREDLISVKEGNYEDDSNSVKKGAYTESFGSSHYEDDPSQEADNSTSVKEGFHSQSNGSSHYENEHSRDADLISVKEGYYEDDSTSVKDGYYAESVASVYTEDDPSREADTKSVKEGYCASEISDYVSQRSGSSDDDDTMKLHHDGRPDEVKTNGGYESGYQGKSRSEASLSPLSDVTDHVDDEDEYRSAIMPLTSHSKDQKIQEQGKETSLNTNSATTSEAVGSSVHEFGSDSDHKQRDLSPKSEHGDSDTSVQDPESDSAASKANEGLLPQRFSQVQQGLTSWFKWKA